MNELRLKIEQLIKELENKTENRHMNDLEYGRYCTLNEVLEMINDVVYETETMNKYIFYSKGTNQDNADDVAITEANSLKEAVKNFQKYYGNASKDNVQIINCHRKNYVDNMMIVSDY